MTIPLNRVVAFVGPYVSIVAAGAAAWLVGHVNLLGIVGIDQNHLESAIAAGITALLTAGAVELGRSQWLKGHHILLATAAQTPVDDEPGDVAGVEDVA